VIGFISCCVAFAATAQADSDDALLRQLRARGLSELTEAYSKKRLANRDLEPAEREAAAIELANATSQRASTEMDPAARRAGWAEADAVIEPFLRAATGNDAEAFEFRYRHALMIRDRAETVVELLKAVPNDEDLIADAREQAERAESLLIKLAEEVRRRMNQSAGGDPKKFERLANLDIRVDFNAGVASVIRVMQAPSGPVRTQSAERAETRLRNYTRSFSILALNMESYLWLGKLFKELERYEEAAQIVAVFEVHPEAPPPYPQRAELLAAQILLAQDKSSAALAKLNVPENKRVPNSGEWDVALFEAMLRSSRPDVAAPKGRRDEAIELLSGLETKYGGYWKARGEQVLAKYGDPDVIGDNPKLLARVASLRRERKELDAAVKMFDQAAQLERAANDPDATARSLLAAAGTVLDQGNAAAAAERYRKIAEEFAQSPLAADAWLGAARALFPAVQSGDANAKAAYQTALDRLLGISNAAPSLRHEANWLRGRLAADDKDYATATARLREIPAEHPRAPAALGALAGVHYASLLGGKERLAGGQTVAAAVEDLESRLKALPPGDPGVAGHRAIAAWVLARLIADYQPERLRDAVHVALNQVVVEPSFPQGPNRVWQTILEWQLRLGDVNGAVASIDRGFKDDAKGLASVLLTLSPLDEGLSDPEIKTRAAVAQHAVDVWLGKSDPLPDQLRASFKLISGHALAARKEYPDAVRLLRQLREESPRDVRAAKALGRVYFLAGEYRESLNEWSALVRGVRPGHEEWLNAVAESARCHLELGDRASASQLLKLVETNHQDKGSNAVRRKLVDVRKKAER
jgi:tetratricopeptide (TPR) repeat protein